MRSDILLPGLPSPFRDEETARAAGLWAKWALFGDDRAGAIYRVMTSKTDKSMTRAQNEGSATAGGFVVPTELASAVFALLPLFGSIAANANPRRMGSDTLNVPTGDGAVVAYYASEAQQVSETEETFGSIGLSAKKLLALLRISSELAEDAVGLAEHLARVLASAIADKQDASGWNGDGTATHAGITGITVKLIDGAHDASKVSAATGNDTFAELTAADLGSVIALCPEYALAGAKWFCSGHAVGNTFARLGATAGGMVMSATGPRPLMQYLGWPIVATPKLPGTGDQSAKVMVAFGDLVLASSFGLRRKITIKQTQSRYIENDQIGVRASTRFDFVAHDLGDNTNPGPLVGLVGN